MEIDIKHLRQIEALDRHRNFGKAAKELKISQPALSRSIMGLEENLGFKLFDRSPRRRDVTLTVYGRRALEIGKSILQDSTKLARDLEMLANLESGTIRIGIGLLVAEAFLGKILGEFYADYPRFTVRTTMDWIPGLMAQLNKGALDVVIGDSRFVKNKDLYKIEPLPQLTACYVCRPGHPLLSRKKIYLKNIFSYPIGVVQVPPALLDHFSRLIGLKITSIDEFPNGLVEVPYSVLVEIIPHSDVIGIGVQPVFQKGLSKGELELLPIKERSITTSYEIISLERYSYSPGVQLFLEYVKKTIV